MATSPMLVRVIEKTGMRGLLWTRSFSERCMKYSPSLPTRHVPSITAERGGSEAYVSCTASSPSRLSTRTRFRSG